MQAAWAQRVVVVCDRLSCELSDVLVLTHLAWCVYPGSAVDIYAIGHFLSTGSKPLLHPT
jgi:hypothetical protein